MNVIKHYPLAILAVGAALLAYPPAARAQDSSQTAVAEHTVTRRDGQHDFDFEIGTWKTGQRQHATLSSHSPMMVARRGS